MCKPSRFYHNNATSQSGTYHSTQEANTNAIEYTSSFRYRL